jgi:hypothetical protein
MVIGVLAVALCAACVPVRQEERAADESARLASEGYRLMTYQGRQMYCREEMMTGSAFSRRNCLSSEQLAERERRVREMVDTRDLGDKSQCGKLCP